VFDVAVCLYYYLILQLGFLYFFEFGILLGDVGPHT